MFQFVETIKIENGVVVRPAYHQARINRTFKVYYEKSDPFLLDKILLIPEKYKKGIIKLRFLYSNDGYKMESSFLETRNVETLKVVVANDIDYSFKFTDRTQINDLFKQRGACDDILIVKNGFVTDTSIANIIFFDGKRLITPDTPLLPGTHRAWMIANKLVEPKPIRIEDVRKFTRFGIVNALSKRGGDFFPIEGICF